MHTCWTHCLLTLLTLLSLPAMTASKQHQLFGDHTSKKQKVISQLCYARNATVLVMVRNHRATRTLTGRCLTSFSNEYVDAISQDVCEFQIEFCHSPKVALFLVLFDFLGCHPVLPEWEHAGTLRCSLSIQN